MPMYQFVCSHPNCGERFPTAEYMNVYRFEQQRALGFPAIECPGCGANKPKTSLNHGSLTPRDITPSGTFGRNSSPAIRGMSFYGKVERDRLLASVGSGSGSDEGYVDDARPSTTRVYKVVDGKTQQVAGPPEGPRAPSSDLERAVMAVITKSSKPLGAKDVTAKVNVHQTATLTNVRKVLSNMAKDGDATPPLHRPERGKYAVNPEYAG